METYVHCLLIIPLFNAACILFHLNIDDYFRIQKSVQSSNFRTEPGETIQDQLVCSGVRSNNIACAKLIATNSVIAHPDHIKFFRSIRLQKIHKYLSNKGAKRVIILPLSVKTRTTRMRTITELDQILILNLVSSIFAYCPKIKSLVTSTFFI